MDVSHTTLKNNSTSHMFKKSTKSEKKDTAATCEHHLSDIFATICA